MEIKISANFLEQIHDLYICGEKYNNKRTNAIKYDPYFLKFIFYYDRNFKRMQVNKLYQVSNPLKETWIRSVEKRSSNEDISIKVEFENRVIDFISCSSFSIIGQEDKNLLVELCFRYFTINYKIKEEKL